MPRRSNRTAALSLALLLLVAPAAAPAPAGAESGGGPVVQMLDDFAMVGELTTVGQPVDHVVLAWDEIIDPRFLPDPDDFTISIGPAGSEVDHHPTAVSLQFSGAASDSFGFGGDGVSFMRLELPSGVTLDVDERALLDYVPDAVVVRDLAQTPSPGFWDVPVSVAEIGIWAPIAFIVDAYHGADKLVVALSNPIEPTSLPDRSQFTVTVDSVEVEVQAVANLYPNIGMTFLELTLPDAITSETTPVSVAYDATPTTLISRFTGTPLDSFGSSGATVIISTNAAGATLVAGESLSTSTGAPTAGDPLATTIVAVADGPAAITESIVTEPDPAGYSLFGFQSEITLPDAPDPSTPNVLTFAIDASVVPAGQTAATVVVFRNGVAVPDCTGAPGEAVPSPCVSERIALGDGDIGLTVLTVQASTWNLGFRPPFGFGGFQSPVDGAVPNLARAGSAIPVRFSLDGFRGLEILEAGSPSSRPVDCASLTDGDLIEQTVTSGQSGLSYDAATDAYTYVWKTAKEWNGTCRRLAVSFVDGSSASALFDFRR
ncbi:MAG TPA: PxKF domain-containing protein [Candidatus Limnocylindria bacterium]|nr:PxKF domain-containing protein [Candidatus Limnocylindria bacterium]